MIVKEIFVCFGFHSNNDNPSVIGYFPESGFALLLFSELDFPLRVINVNCVYVGATFCVNFGIDSSARCVNKARKRKDGKIASVLTYLFFLSRTGSNWTRSWFTYLTIIQGKWFFFLALSDQLHHSNTHTRTVVQCDCGLACVIFESQI